MKNYLTDAFFAASLRGITPSRRAVAEELRSMLGDEKVIEIYHDLKDKENEFETEGYCSSDYHFYWIATKLIEMDKNGESQDGLKYPDTGWLDFELWEPLMMISCELSFIIGATANSMVIYKDGTLQGTKGFIGITFDSIESYNRFIWAGNYRYFTIDNTELWRLVPDMADPDWRETRLKFELHYLDMNADAKKMYIDFKDLAEGIRNYANIRDDDEMLKSIERSMNRKRKYKIEGTFESLV